MVQIRSVVSEKQSNTCNENTVEVLTKHQSSHHHLKIQRKYRVL